MEELLDSPILRVGVPKGACRLESCRGDFLNFRYMKRIEKGVWEYKGYTIIKSEWVVYDFPFEVYDDEGFCLDAFRNREDCKKYIDGLS